MVPQSHDPIATLLALTERLAEGLPIDQALSAVTDAALTLLPGDHASIRLVDEAGEELVANARSGEGRDHRSVPLRRGEGIAGWVLAEGRSAYVADVRHDPRFVSLDQGFAVGSLIVAPLLHRGRPVGVLSVSSARPGAFEEAHERLVRLLASTSIPTLERARLEHLAVTDALTLAYNGRYLVPRLREEIDRARHGGLALSVAMLDLDHFKRANDTCGHAAGDRLLRAFADRVREKTRRSDVLVRRGGEEFVLLLPSTPAGAAIALAERICSSVREPIPMDDGRSLTQTVSIGVASWDGREPADALVHRADLAMYEAKRSGRDRVIAAGPGSVVRAAPSSATALSR